jgi:hypothetical protein
MTRLILVTPEHKKIYKYPSLRKKITNKNASYSIGPVETKFGKEKNIEI